MTRVSMILDTVLATACALPAVGAAQVVVGPGGGTPATAKNFKVIGHDPLFAIGMNAAPAIFSDFLYVGNRTDGSSSCGVDESGSPVPGQCSHPDPGISIVDIARSVRHGRDVPPRCVSSTEADSSALGSEPITGVR